MNRTVPNVSDRRGPTQKLLNPWLGMTRNKVHSSQMTVIFRAWAVGSGYKIGGTEPIRMQIFLRWRGHRRASARWRGVVNSFLAMMVYYGVDPDAMTDPDGRDEVTLVST